jgi:ATP-dependent Clp protease ATP-binding subunit ClpA
VGTEHLLYALVSQENTAATVILENMKVNPQDVKDQVIEAFERSRMQELADYYPDLAPTLRSR